MNGASDVIVEARIPLAEFESNDVVVRYTAESCT